MTDYYDYRKGECGTIWLPIVYVPIELQQKRNNTTPNSMECFENEQVINVVQSDEELEVDVESDHYEKPKVEKVSVIKPLSSIIKSEPLINLQMVEVNDNRKRKILDDSSCSSKKTKLEPSFVPETDETLSEFTPRSSFRVIEEHYQYKGDEPGEHDRQYKCKYCRKVFRRKEEKKRHENSHLNIRPHKCRLCDKTFMRADHRNSHEKTHSKEKEFKCEICNKSFRRADEAKRHEQRQIHLRNVARLRKNQ